MEPEISMSKVVSKTSPLLISITPEMLGAKAERADRVIAALEGMPSRSQLKDWFLEGRIKRGLELLEPKTKIAAGDKISILVAEPKLSKLTPKKIPLEILFEDNSLIVLYKPKGLKMHPGAGKKDEATLAHGLVARSKELSDRSGEFRPGIVHRLDKDTEGIVVVAKNNEIHEALSSQFSDRSIRRAYWALCYGQFPKEMTIEGAIGRHPKQRQKMAVTAKGKPARTDVKLVRYFEAGYSWVECKLRTGRTHQIRVHLSHKGFPLLGDLVYGRTRKIKGFEKALEKLKGQALVAYELGFTHPVTGEKLNFKAKAPQWLKDFTE